MARADNRSEVLVLIGFRFYETGDSFATKIRRSPPLESKNGLLFSGVLSFTCRQFKSCCKVGGKNWLNGRKAEDKSTSPLLQFSVLKSTFSV